MAILVSGLTEVCWRIIPLEPPRVVRHCAKCGQIRAFACSDNFRLNAQQRKIDVWLIYRCLTCESAWKCTIFTRCTPEEIGKELYARLQHNDRDLAWRYAFDFSLLHRLGVQVDAVVKFRVERIPLNGARVDKGEQKIRLELVQPCSVRLDRLLVEALNVPRTRLQRWCDRGLLCTWPEEKNMLRKPIRNGQIIWLLPDLHASDVREGENASVAAGWEEQ